MVLTTSFIFKGDIRTYLELAEKEEGEGGEKALYWQALLELCKGRLEEVTDSVMCNYNPSVALAIIYLKLVEPPLRFSTCIR